jgi:Cd2+/Zn2+-exporting ATPase
VSTAVSVVLLAIAVVASLAGASRVIAEPLYLASMAVGGWPIARAALAGLRRRSLDMNVLMTLAAVGGDAHRQVDGLEAETRAAQATA